MTKRRYIINFVVVIVLAVVSGYFIGSYIAGGRLVALSNTYNELGLRGITDVKDVPTYYSELPQSYLNNIVTMAEGKTPDKLTAINAFLVAEYKTNTSSTVHKTTSGVIKAKAMGLNVNQKLLSVKTKQDGKIYLDKVSYSSMAKVAVKVEHTLNTDTYAYYKGTANENLTASWGKPTNKPVSDYRGTFGSGLDYFTNYLITPSTVLDSQTSKVTKHTVKEYNEYFVEGKNYYKFSLALDIRVDETTGDFIYGGVSNYMYEIRTTASAENFPVFYYCNLNVIVDDEFRLVQVDVDENYQIVTYGFNANTTGDIVEMYRYQ